VSADRTAAAPPRGVAGSSVPSWAAPLSLLLVLLGLAVSAYLTAQHFSSSLVLACPDRGVIDCAKVTTSDQSELAGVPVALLGLLWFAALLPLVLPRAWRAGRLRLPRLAAVGLGVPMVLYLVYTEAITLRALCLYCTAVHVVAVLLFAVVALATALSEPVAERLSRPPRP
jgi:uncharacterized membrane protein